MTLEERIEDEKLRIQQSIQNVRTQLSVLEKDVGANRSIRRYALQSLLQAAHTLTLEVECLDLLRIVKETHGA